MTELNLFQTGFEYNQWYTLYKTEINSVHYCFYCSSMQVVGIFVEYQQLMISVGRVGGVYLKVRALRLIHTK
jgi:hypothetical protein